MKGEIVFDHVSFEYPDDHNSCLLYTSSLDPNRFIGFATVDPNRPDALNRLRHAFETLKLRGLKLHPSKQQFYPNDPKLFPIYELCLSYNAVSYTHLDVYKRQPFF